jgi:hypothetical protein
MRCESRKQEREMKVGSMVIANKVRFNHKTSQNREKVSGKPGRI